MRHLRRALAVCVLSLAATLTGCLSSSPFTEDGSSFMMETNRAKYYNVRGRWKSRPNIDTTTVKRIDKKTGDVLYGTSATKAIDSERVVRSSR